MFFQLSNQFDSTSLVDFLFHLAFDRRATHRNEIQTEYAQQTGAEQTRPIERSQSGQGA